jgi:hypothetical protein
MEDNGLPAVGQLEATPEICALMRELTEEERWKPAPRFSVAEVLAHLSHSEGLCYRLRLDRFMNEERLELEPDDAQFDLDLYRNADPEDSFDQFEEQCESNIEFLRNFPEGAGERRAIHRVAGEITMAQMLHEWAMHDLGHIRQIVELVHAQTPGRRWRTGKVLPIEAMISDVYWAWLDTYQRTALGTDG